MPRLTRPQTLPESVPGQVAPAVDPTAVLAGSVARGLGDVAGVMLRERQRVDEIRVNEAEVAFAAKLDEALSGRDGLLQQQGTKAVTELDHFRDRTRTALSEVEASLSTEEQKALFRRSAAARQQSAFARADAHVGGEERRADTASHRALLERDLTAIPDAVDDAAVSDTVDRVTERIRLYADRNGIPPEAAQVQVKDARSAAWTARIVSALEAGNVAAARLTFDERSDELLPDARAKVQAAVQEASTRQTVVRQADQILTALAKDPTKKAEDLLAEVPLEVRPDVRKYVRGELDAQAAQQKQTYDAGFMGAVNTVEAARRRGDSRPVRMIVGPGVWDAMKLPDRNALDRIGSGDSDKNDDRAWMDFYLLSPQALRGLTQADFTSKYWSRFDQTRKERALERWQAASKAPTTGAAGYFSPTARVERTFQTMFEQPASKSDWDAEQFSAFENAVDAAALDETRSGKKLDDEQFKALTVRVATQMLTAGPTGGMQTGWGQIFQSYNAPPGGFGEVGFAMRDQYGEPTPDEPEKPAVPFDAIPLALRDAIGRQMREQGRAATERRVSRAFTALQLGDTVGYNAEVGLPINPEIVNALRALSFPSFPTAPRKAP